MSRMSKHLLVICYWGKILSNPSFSFIFCFHGARLSCYFLVVLIIKNFTWNISCFFLLSFSVQSLYLTTFRLMFLLCFFLLQTGNLSLALWHLAAVVFLFFFAILFLYVKPLNTNLWIIQESLVQHVTDNVAKNWF